MAALGSQSIASSYEQLLHVDADGGGNSTTHVSVKDGDNGTTFGFTIATDALMMSSTNRLEFGDTGTYIHQSADGVLDLVSDTEIEINATTIDINGAVDISGNITMADDTSIGISDSDERIEFDGAGDISVLGANFGIGTVSPVALFDITVGNDHDNSADDFMYIGKTNEASAYAALQCIQTGAASAADRVWKFQTIEQGIANDGGITLQASGGYVGIGANPSKSHKLDVTGTAGLSTGTAWTNTSDERIKTNVETIENGLDKINQLRPVSFNYSEDYLEQHPEINASKKYNSFIAQEYVDVFPDAVSIGGNLEKVIVESVKAVDGIEAVQEEKETLVEDMLQFTPHDLNMYLVAAVKELSAKVEALEG
jgi:hypothetical protein